MFTDDGQYGGGRRSYPGSFPPVIPQDCNLSRRVCVFHLAAPDGGECRPHAVTQEGSSSGSFGRHHGDGRRNSAERTGSAGSSLGWLRRPVAVAAGGGGVTTGLSHDFFAA